jgi:hypothetical protein
MNVVVEFGVAVTTGVVSVQVETIAIFDQGPLPTAEFALTLKKYCELEARPVEDVAVLVVLLVTRLVEKSLLVERCKS